MNRHDEEPMVETKYMYIAVVKNGQEDRGACLAEQDFRAI